MYVCMYHSVPQIRPPLCNLSLSTKCRGGGGGVYAGCEYFSRDYNPQPPLPVKHDLIVGGGGGGSKARQRDASES